MRRLYPCVDFMAFSNQFLKSAFKTLTLLNLLFLFTVSGLYAQEGHPQKVLFVGNSYIYFWNLPHQVAAMAQSQGVELKTVQSTNGGSNWAQHWRGEENIRSREIIQDGDFDAVVIQNHSMRSFDAPDSLMHYGKLFSNLIKSRDAQVYLYMTWAREWDPYMQKTIAAAYTGLAEEIDAIVVPVGLAWQRARELRPDIDLYAEDGSHPSPLGTYLTACVFYQVLTGQTVIGLPPRLMSQDIHGEKLYLNILSEENALFLQKVADETVTIFGSEQ